MFVSFLLVTVIMACFYSQPTVLPVKSDSDAIIYLYNNQGLIIDISLV